VADDKGPIERAADLFVYAPIGFAVLARDLGAAALADMAKRGRSEIDQAQKRVGNQITQYRFVGQYAVDQELTPRVKPVVDELKRAFDRLTGGFAPSSPTAPARPAQSPTTAPAPAPVVPQPSAGNGAAADMRAQQEADRAAAAALRESIVGPAQRSPAALLKQRRGITADGLPVHSFRSLLADLATLTRNTVEMPLEGARELTIYARPTAVQQKAFALLGISPERTQ